MYDPKTRKIVADQETAQEQLEQLAHAMIFDPSSRQLLERGDQGVEDLFTRLNLNPTARRTAIDILSNFNYDALQRLAAAFGFKDPDDIN
jgi:hypothetical protein